MPGERLSNPRFEADGHGVIRQSRLYEVVELPAERELVAARETGFEVRLQVGERLACQRPVEIREELAYCLLAAEPGHASSPLTKPRRFAHSQSSRSRIFRARCSRDITVPTGQPSASARSR